MREFANQPVTVLDSDQHTCAYCTDPFACGQALTFMPYQREDRVVFQLVHVLCALVCGASTSLHD